MRCTTPVPVGDFEGWVNPVRPQCAKLGARLSESMERVDKADESDNDQNATLLHVYDGSGRDKFRQE
jgi:hypothetical protein